MEGFLLKCDDRIRRPFFNGGANAHMITLGGREAIAAGREGHSGPERSAVSLRISATDIPRTSDGRHFRFSDYETLARPASRPPPAVFPAHAQRREGFDLPRRGRPAV